MGKRIGYFNLVNYKDHPTNGLYKVLNFNSEPEAELFEKKLIEHQHFYEKDVDTHNGKSIYLFAVKNREFDAIQKYNFEVSAAFRKPMIKNKYARYALVSFFLLIMSLAIAGYFINEFD